MKTKLIAIISLALLSVTLLSSCNSPSNTDNHNRKTSSGLCNHPDDLDIRGYRCGKRAASVRPGGK
jgi:hypothetical protein